MHHLDVFTWIHAQFAELLLQLHFDQSCLEDEPVLTSMDRPVNSKQDQTNTWNLKKIFTALPKKDIFKVIVYSTISGSKAVCFESTLKEDAEFMCSSFNALLPTEDETFEKIKDSLWHYCSREKMSECQNMMCVKLVSDGGIIETRGLPISGDYLTSYMVCQICEILAKSDIDW